MRKFFVIVTLVLISLPAHSATGGDEATQEPVNVVAESDIDIGPCAAGGSLTYPPAPYKGSAYFLLKADAALAAGHEALTSRRPSWLRRLEGPSSANRLFTSPSGARVVVFSACKPRDCSANAAYGAYELHTKEYALQIRASGEPNALGSASPALAAAITCARAHDDRVRGQAAEALKRQTRK